MLRRIIAKELLIILGLVVLIFFFNHFIFKNTPVILPRYKLDFINGETYVITIMPKIRTYSHYSSFLEEAYNPSEKLIEKRIKEFKETIGIKSVLKDKRQVNARQVNLSRLYSKVAGVPFVFKLGFVYIVLFSIRFIAWVVKVLAKHSLQH